MDKTTKRRDDVKILLAYFAGYMVGMTALSYVLERFAAISSTSVLGLIINAVASVLLLGYIVMKKRAELAAAWRTARQAPGKNSWFVVKYFFFAYLATMPVVLLLAALQVTNQNQATLVGLFGGALWYAVFMAVVFGDRRGGCLSWSYLCSLIAKISCSCLCSINGALCPCTRSTIHAHRRNQEWPGDY